MFHFADADDRINAGWPAYEAALKAMASTTRPLCTQGTAWVQQDTTPRYDPAAAKLAWQRTIEFFDAHLGNGRS